MVSGLPSQTVVMGGGGRGQHGPYKVMMAGSGAFANVRQGVGLGAKNPKPCCPGLVSVLLCHTAMVGGGQRWWHGPYKETAAVGQSIRKHKVGVGGQKSEIMPLWLDFRSATP